MMDPQGNAAGQALVGFCRLPKAVPAHQVERLLAGLGPRQRVRADQIRRSDVLVRFAASRALLDRLLARSIGADPAAGWDLEAEAGGAPRLVAPGLATPPGIGLAHSGTLVAAGVVAGGRIGIDVEVPDRLVDWRAIAASQFAAAERTRLQSLPADQGRALFFRLWTLKEAFAKYHGQSIFRHLAATRVDPGPPVYFRSTAADCEPDLSGWLHEIAGGGLLAVAGRGGPPPVILQVDFRGLF